MGARSQDAKDSAKIKKKKKAPKEMKRRAFLSPVLVEEHQLRLVSHESMRYSSESLLLWASY